MDELLSSRNLSRNSSIGCSSRIYYYRSTEGVAFNWERQPGTSKNPPKEEALPPISPPPAVISLGLPKPCIDVQQSKPPRRPRLRFWRKSKKNKNNITVVNNVGGGSDKFDMFDFCTSDSEFMASTSPRNSSSSSSSSFSFSKGRLSRDCSSLRSTPARDSFSSRNNAAAHHLTCSPWNLSSVLISIARRV